MLPINRCVCDKDKDKDASLTKGDDTNAFGFNFMTIELEDIEGALDDHTISKAEFQCGPLLKVFETPEFPLTINLSHEETKMLKHQNKCYLRVYDENSLRITCEGELEFDTRKEVVNES